MNRTLLRIVTLLLVPCLAGDAFIPAGAATFGKQEATMLADPVLPRVSVEGARLDSFSQEALMLPSISSQFVRPKISPFWLLRRLAIIPVVVAGLSAQTVAPTPSSADQMAESHKLDEASAALQNLQASLNELSQILNHFPKEIDKAIAANDPGPHLNGGGPEVASIVKRKVYIAEMVTSDVKNMYDQAAFEDFLKLQALLKKITGLAEASERASRPTLMISATARSRQNDKRWNDLNDERKRARTKFETLKAQAWSLLSSRLANKIGEEEEVISQAATITLGGKGIPPEGPKKDPSAASKAEADKEGFFPTLDLPLHQRILLVSELGYRMALMFEGVDPLTGDYTFCLEELMSRHQRGSSGTTEWIRRRVAVNPKTGKHLTTVVYPPLEFKELDVGKAYLEAPRFAALWYLEPPPNSSEPSRPDMEAAIAATVHAANDLRAATAEFRSAVARAEAANAQLNKADGKTAPDAELPADVRHILFALRSLAAGVPEMRSPADALESAKQKAYDAVRKAQNLGAWGNSAARKLPNTVWMDLQSKADNAIYAVRAAAEDPLARMPHELSPDWLTYKPRPDGEYIIGLRQLPFDGKTVLTMQVVLHKKVLPPGKLQSVSRRITLIATHPETGHQIILGGTWEEFVDDADLAAKDILDQHAGPDRSAELLPAARGADNAMAELERNIPASDALALLSKLKNPAATEAERRLALNQLAAKVPRQGPVPATGAYAFLQAMAQDPQLMSLLLKQINGNTPAAIDAAWILAALPESAIISRPIILLDLLQIFPEVMAPGDMRGPVLNQAWVAMAQRSSEEAFISFFKLADKSPLVARGRWRFNAILIQLAATHFLETLKRDPAAQRILLDSFESLIDSRIGDPEPLIDLMGLLQEVPGIKTVLDSAVQYLSNAKADAVLAGRREHILLAMTGGRDWSLHETDPLKDLLLWSMGIGENDVVASKKADDLIAQRMQKPETFQTLVGYFKELMVFDRSSLKPPEYRMMPLLLILIGQGPVESLQQDEEFQESLWRYVEPRLTGRNAAVDTALHLVSRLDIPQAQRKLESILQDKNKKTREDIDKAGFLADPKRKQTRTDLMRTILRRPQALMFFLNSGEERRRIGYRVLARSS